LLTAQLFEPLNDLGISPHLPRLFFHAAQLHRIDVPLPPRLHQAPLQLGGRWRILSVVWLEDAGSSLTCYLAATILAGSGLACPGVWGRWLLVWLLGSIRLTTAARVLNRRAGIPGIAYAGYVGEGPRSEGVRMQDFRHGRERSRPGDVHRG
jgi:hypothetical protein